MTNLQDIIKEAEKSLVKLWGRYTDDLSSVGYNNLHSLLTERITKAVNSALEATQVDLTPIENALDKLIELGDIKCSIPECGDEECAAVIVRNEIHKAVAEQAKKRERFLERNKDV